MRLIFKIIVLVLLFKVVTSHVTILEPEPQPQPMRFVVTEHAAIPEKKVEPPLPAIQPKTPKIEKIKVEPAKEPIIVEGVNTPIPKKVVPPPVKPKMLIHKSLADATEFAKVEDKKVFIIFVGPGCAICKKVENVALKDKAVQQYIIDHYALTVIDVSKDRSTAALFGLGPGSTIPQGFIYSPVRGEAMWKMFPDSRPSVFLNQMKESK